MTLNGKVMEQASDKIIDLESYRTKNRIDYVLGGASRRGAQRKKLDRGEPGKSSTQRSKK